MTKTKKTIEVNNDDNDVLTKYEYLLAHPQSIPSGYKAEIVYKDNKPFEIAFVPNLNNQATLMNKIETFGTWPYILEADLKDFKINSALRKELLIKGGEFNTNYKKGKIQKGFYLSGNFRTGKTYFFSAMAKELVKYASVAFFYVPDLMRNMHTSMNDFSLEEKINYLKEVDILFLDDLGATPISSWFRDSCLNPIVNSRLIRNKPTFISTNHNDSALIGILANNETEQTFVSGLVFKIRELTTRIVLDDYNL